MRFLVCFIEKERMPDLAGLLGVTAKTVPYDRPHIRARPASFPSAEARAMPRD